MTDTPTPEFVWHRYVKRPSRIVTIWPSLLLLFMFGALAAVCPVIGLPWATITAGAIASMSLMGLVPLRVRIEVQSNSVVVRKLPVPTNVWVWMTVVMTVGAIGLTLQAFVGNTADTRLLILCVALYAVALLSGRYAFSLRGSMRIDSEALYFRGGAEVPVAGTSIEVANSTSQGDPVVRLVPVEAIQSKFVAWRINARLYGLDLNTLASTLVQLATWAGEGRVPGPEQIKAMLTVKAPDGLAVGGSVTIPIPSSPSGSYR